MNPTIKTAITVCGFLVAVSAPLSAGADTQLFSGKGATGSMYGYSGPLSFSVNAFENVTNSNKSNKIDSSGAYAYGNYYTGSQCWVGWGSTDTVQVKSVGTLPKQVTATGSILMNWYEWCSGSGSFTETITFNMDLSAIKDQASQNWANIHNEYGTYKYSYISDSSSAPAAINGSYFSSPSFGTIIPNYGYVGQSKYHSVTIAK